MDSLGCSVPRGARDFGSCRLGILGHGDSADSHHCCRGNLHIRSQETFRISSARNRTGIPRSGSAFRCIGTSRGAHVSSAAIAGVTERASIERIVEFASDCASANSRRADQRTSQPFCADHRRSAHVFRASSVCGGSRGEKLMEALCGHGWTWSGKWRGCFRWRVTATNARRTRFPYSLMVRHLSRRSRWDIRSFRRALAFAMT